MRGRVLILFFRLWLGILLILNGPTNAIAFGLPLLRSGSSADPKPPTKHKPQCSCNGCAAKGQAHQQNQKNAPEKPGNNSRPSCPLCPSCPGSPGGCGICCPGNTPCSLPLVFGVPEAAELFWRVTDDNIALSDSHPDEPFLPPRL